VLEGRRLNVLELLMRTKALSVSEGMRVNEMRSSELTSAMMSGRLTMESSAEMSLVLTRCSVSSSVLLRLLTTTCRVAAGESDSLGHDVSPAAQRRPPNEPQRPRLPPASPLDVYQHERKVKDCTEESSVGTFRATSKSERGGNQLWPRPRE
jgi:hypothetical protein